MGGPKYFLFFVVVFNIWSESVARIGNKKVKFEFPKSLEKPEDLVNHFFLAKFGQRWIEATALGGGPLALPPNYTLYRSRLFPEGSALWPFSGVHVHHLTLSKSETGSSIHFGPWILIGSSSSKTPPCCVLPLGCLGVTSSRGQWHVS